MFENCQFHKKPILSGMKGKKLNFQQVLKLTQTYMHRRGQALIQYLYPFKTKRGRPKKYPDEIILTLERERKVFI